MFYIMEVDDNQYDLFSSATDNKILKAEPKEKIINFLEFNSPSHPFLVKTNQESDSKYYSDYFRYVSDEDISKYQFSKIDISRHAPEGKGPTDTDDSDYFMDQEYGFNYDNYTDTAEHENLFDYDSRVDYFVGKEEEKVEEKGSPIHNTQLEFEFTYKDKEDKNTSSPNSSSDNEEGELPPLPGDEE